MLKMFLLVLHVSLKIVHNFNTVYMTFLLYGTVNSNWWIWPNKLSKHSEHSYLFGEDVAIVRTEFTVWHSDYYKVVAQAKNIKSSRYFLKAILTFSFALEGAS